MHIHLLAVGTRMPGWVDQGFADYAARLPREWGLRLAEIPAARRGSGGGAARAVAHEGERMLAAIPSAARAVALDEHGAGWSTRDLAQRLADWMRGGTDVALLVGGADGLAPACLERARERWSLSALTLPHGLVRVIVAEQLYRAWTILNRHPYHRA